MGMNNYQKLTSKGETIHRDPQKAKEHADRENAGFTPLQALEWLQEGGISREEAEKCRVSLRTEREAAVKHFERFVRH
ncbi:MAG: hypothetical protein QM680_05180 [Luteolibacter sp.]